MEVNGFYRVDFGAMHDGGPGVVVLEDGKVRGSDGKFIFSGQYIEHDGNLRVALKVTPIVENAVSVFGPEGASYTLEMIGEISVPWIRLTAEAPFKESPKLFVRGFKVGELA